MCDAVGDGRVDRVFRDIATNAQIVVVTRLSRKRPALALHLVGGLPCADQHFANAAHRLAVRRDNRERAEVVQDIFGGNGLAPDAALGKGHVLGDRLVEVVADHQHIEMLFERVHRVGPRRVCAGRDHIAQARQLDNVWRMAAARALGMEGMDRTILEGGNRVLDKAGLVQRVGMDHHLHVHVVSDTKATINRGGGRTPVLMQFQRTSSCADLFDQRGGFRRIALAREAEVHREAVGGLQHSAQMPRTGGAGGGVRSGRRTRATAEHRCHTAHQRILGSQLNVYAPKKSSILTITGHSKSPEMAKLMAEKMISVFMEEHLRSSATPGSLKFFSTEVEQSEDQLAKLLQQRCDFLTTEKMVSVDAKRAMLSDKLVTLNRDILNAKANVQQTRAKIADLNLKIAAMDDEIVVSRNQLSSNTWSGIRQRVYDLEVAERNMSAIYKDSHPTLVNTQEQLQSARDIMEKVKTDDVNENTAINPAKAKAEEELRLLQTSFVGLETEVKEKVHEQKLADTEVNQLLENERKLVDLNRNISVLESNLSLLNQKMEESRLIEELEREQFSNVSVVQPASLTQRPVSPKKPVLGNGFHDAGRSDRTLSGLREKRYQRKCAVGRIAAAMGGWKSRR